MLQDLAFGRLDNHYEDHAPKKGDIVLCMQGNGILVARDKLDALTLPNGSFLPTPNAWEKIQDVAYIQQTALNAVNSLLQKHPDTARIGITGNSGGGTATYYTACLDERIKLAVPSCAVCTYKHSIAAMRHCVCNFIPNIATYFDMGDLAGLIAPRKLVVVNGKDVPIFPEAGVQESYEVIKKMYAAAGVPDNCALVTGNGAHRFYADDAWPVLHKMMGK